MAFNYSPKIVTDGLVLYLDAANTKSYVSGSTTWRDISRSGINGTLTNGPTFNSANGGSIVFDGVNDYVDCSNNTLLQLNENLTISVWTYVTAPKTGLGLITKGPISSDYDYMLYLSINSTGFSFFKKNSSGTAEQSGGFISTFLNKWTNVCFTKQGIIVTSYENATRKFTSNLTDSEIRSSSNSLKIGSGFGTAYGGNLPILQIYNRALTPQEILQNYNATKTRFGL